MAKPIKTIAKFACIVILTGFISFFVSISIIDSSFLYYLWLPFLIFHYILALIINIVHKKRDKIQGEKTKSGLFLSFIYVCFITGVSIINISIIISICKDPYCKEIRIKNIDPIIVYTIIAIFEYFNLCTFFDFCFIKIAGKRNLLYRLIISFPVSLHCTTCVFSSFFLWAYPIFAYLSVNYYDYFVYLPVILYIFIYLFSINGLYNSLFTNWSYIYIDMTSLSLSSSSASPLLLDNNPSRCNIKNYRINKEITENEEITGNKSIIKICQITDPHIGPMMSIKRLQEICKNIIKKEPDLVLLTGDYFTGEANMDGLLIEGNHDMESDAVYHRTIKELKELGIKLLQNESIIYDKITKCGPIQIIGFDYIYHGDSNRYNKLRNILNDNPCPIQCENRRIVLLHDPGGFRAFNGDENLIVFSGHTHGGHCGIISCGFQWTFFYQALKMPDNGLWEKGNNKLYIHRGQGSRALYGNYVLRNGVPTEQSLIHIEW